jgi:hypothetical protein
VATIASVFFSTRSSFPGLSPHSTLIDTRLPSSFPVINGLDITQLQHAFNRLSFAALGSRLSTQVFKADSSRTWCD